MQKIDSFINKVPEKVKKFYYSQWYLLSLVVLVFLTWILKQPAFGFVLGSILVAIGLVVVDDITILFAPIIYIPCMINNKDFMVYLPYLAGAIPLVLGLIFHICYYKPNKNNKPKMLYPLIAITIAMLLGGCNVMDTETFVGGIGMVLGLGLAGLIVYLFFNAYAKENQYIKQTSYIAKSLLWYGVIIALQITSFYIINDTSFLEMDYLAFIDVGWSTSNNLATILLVTAPIGYYLALTEDKYKWLYTIMSLVHYCFIFLSFSRGGMLFALITGIISTVWVMIKADKKDRKSIYIPIILTAMGVLAFAGICFDKIADLFGKFTSGNDILTGRDVLYREAIEIFMNNPLFGGGMGVRGESYNPFFKEMPYYWFHSTFFQILACTGLLGLVAFLWYYIARYKIVFQKIKVNLFAQFIFLGLIGFEGYSLIDTGTFIPYPIMIMVTLLTLYIENSNKSFLEKITE